jgi:single-stranded-DNA-specific exonuclease
LENVTPEFYRSLCLLEPFGMENPEPVFIDRSVRLMAPPQNVKDKHVRLRIAPSVNGANAIAATAGTDFMPRCHPDSAAISKRAANTFGTIEAGKNARPTQSWRSNVTFNAMGWGMKATCDQLQLLAGDRFEIAYSLGMNDHPEFGGLELTLRDVTPSK